MQFLLSASFFTHKDTKVIANICFFFFVCPVLRVNCQTKLVTNLNSFKFNMIFFSVNSCLVLYLVQSCRFFFGYIFIPLGIYYTLTGSLFVYLPFSFVDVVSAGVFCFVFFLQFQLCVYNLLCFLLISYEFKYEDGMKSYTSVRYMNYFQ